MSEVSLTLVLPPLSQLNTPYPSIAYLARALRAAGRECAMSDLGIELMLRVFSRAGLTTLFDELEDRDELPEAAWRALALRHHHIRVIEPVIRFLQGQDRTLANRIVEGGYLPAGPRVEAADLSLFGLVSTDDAARRLCTLYIEDLSDLITSTLDLGFGLSRYGHHLATGPVTWAPIEERLNVTTFIDQMLDEEVDRMVSDSKPSVVGLSVPFPGMLIAALRIGRRLKASGIRVVMGGGYVNTELREVDCEGLWACVDALTYDDGEGPLLALLDYWEGRADRRHRTRTASGLLNQPTEASPTATIADYRGLKLDGYLALIDGDNPAHRLWSDGRWNKMTLAHGCYWKKCAFCDIHLDYIARFEPTRISTLVDAMEQVIADTGQTGFHMVDEAAPPRAMRDLAIEILARDLTVSWWGNIRFERSFTPDLARLLAASGLIAVTGGLEVASDRLLQLMDKGITVEQAARAAEAFSQAGVMVHAYLMYGFPTQSEQETVDAMEVVRQMFAEGLLTSGFWHRFVLTRHSAVYQDPERYGVTIPPLSSSDVFAMNDLPHIDPSAADPDRFDDGLVQAIHAWMSGAGTEQPVHLWFDPPLVPTREHPRRIQRALEASPADGSRLLWIGGEPLEGSEGIVLHTTTDTLVVGGRPEEREWLLEVIDAAHPGKEPLELQEAMEAFPGDWRRFADRWNRARHAGMLLL